MHLLDLPINESFLYVFSQFIVLDLNTSQTILKLAPKKLITFSVTLLRLTDNFLLEKTNTQVEFPMEKPFSFSLIHIPRNTRNSFIN